MAEPSTGPSQIVWRQLRHAHALGGFLHNVPNRLHRHAISPCPSYFVDPAEKFPSINCAHGEFFAAIRPATTFIEVPRFIDPEWLVEVEADCVADP
jgi:enamine deaminase RidA (YjgF/YER057c/UK114 family)